MKWMCSRFLFSATLTLLTLVPGGVAHSKNTCLDLFSSPYWHGQLQASKPPFVVHVLGTGDMGGTVRRITDTRTGKSHLKKNYDDPYSLLNDMTALKLLSKLSLQLQHPAITILQPYKVQRDRSLYFADVRGFALDRLPHHLDRQSLESAFWQWANGVFDVAKDSPGYEFERLESGLWMSYRVPEEELSLFHHLSVIDILLKPDNIIYDSIHRRLVIFDPY